MNSKQTLLIGGGTLCGAIAAVVVMKALPTDNNETANAESDQEPKVESAENGGQASNDSSARGKTNASSLLDEIDKNRPEIDKEEIASRRDQFRNDMRERQMERLTGKIAKWSAALGLDEEEQGKLLDIADAQFDELEALGKDAEGGDLSTISVSAKRAMAIMSGRALEEAMAETLTPEQKEKYEQFGTLQNQSRAEAGALRQLATLQEELMLTPEQRNDVYGIIYEDNIKQAGAGSDVTSMIDQFASQSGVSLDPSLKGMISSLANRGLEQMASGEELNGDSVKDLAESAMADSINEQVERLSPVLSEAQLEIYRSQLESRLTNFGKMIPRGKREE